jgi:hypothetical protein
VHLTSVEPGLTEVRSEVTTVCSLAANTISLSSCSEKHSSTLTYERLPLEAADLLLKLRNSGISMDNLLFEAFDLIFEVGDFDLVVLANRVNLTRKDGSCTMLE